MEVSECDVCRTKAPGLLLTYVGPARVMCSTGNRVKIEFPEMAVWARLALAYPYRPEPGDMVLVISQIDEWYVIGVLSGTGKTSFCVPSDLELCAPKGSIRLEARRRVRITGTDVDLRAKRLGITAHNVIETFGNAKRWVKNAFDLHAGRIKTRVTSIYRLKAKRIDERAEEDVKIDGRKINLG